MSLNNLSIRLQVLIPLLLASLLMLLMAVISKQEIDGAIKDMNDTTTSVTRHKDDIAALIHATYRLRTNAIYGLYDQARFAELPGTLNAAEQEISGLLSRLVIPGAEQDNSQVAAALQAYLGHTRSNMLPLLTQQYRDGTKPAGYEQSRLRFRELGEQLIKQIDTLSAHINQLIQQEIALEQAHYQATLLQTLLLMAATLVAALCGGWWLSGRIVQPIGQLQEVMHAVALGRFNVRAKAEGNNELGQLAKDINQTLSQLGSTIQALTGISGNVASARAGETGRGFAVVADEVRLLAARTQDSTKEIQAIIEQLQSQSLSANSGVQETLEILGHNQRLSAEVQDLLGGITEAVNQINGANAQVATAAEEQSCVTADISRNITNIHEIVNQNVAGITQSAAASHELSQLAEQQRRQLAQFQL